MSLVDAKFDADDLINVSEVTSRKQSGPGFLAYPVLTRHISQNGASYGRSYYIEH